MHGDQKDDASNIALSRVSATEPVLLGLIRAGELIPSLGKREFLHAGPPLNGWHEACGALRGAIVGTALNSGIARTVEEAEAMGSAGEFKLLCANDYGVLGTYGGVIVRDTPLFVVKDRTTGRVAGAAINEGRGKALRYGSTDPETLYRLAWLETDFFEILDRAIRLSGEIDLSHLLVQAIHMGDEGHSRQKAASTLFLNVIAAPLIEAGFAPEDTARVVRFIVANDVFFLPLSMAAAKVSMANAQGVPGAYLVTCMAFNGVRCGIQISGLAQRWFTAPVPKLHGHYFNGFTAADAGPVIGDSEIAETSGLGAFAMAGAPALARYVGGTVQEAARLSDEMYAITISEHPRYKIPAIGYRGTPFGIDARRVVASGITPVFNSGIAHRTAGIGQIGAGFGRVPLECFQKAIDAFSA